VGGDFDAAVSAFALRLLGFVGDRILIADIVGHAWLTSSTSDRFFGKKAMPPV